MTLRNDLISKLEALKYFDSLNEIKNLKHLAPICVLFGTQEILIFNKIIGIFCIIFWKTIKEKILKDNLLVRFSG